MKRFQLFAFLLFLLSSVAPCLAHHMALVVNKNNPVESVTSAHLAKLYRGEIKKWQDGTEVVLVFHSASAGEKGTLEQLLKVSDSELQSLIVSHKNSVKIVGSDAEILKAVESTPGAIGLVDVRSIDGNVKVVKVGGKLPTEAGYLPH
jgi:phosphate transport system substrate-binding protein